MSIQAEASKETAQVKPQLTEEQINSNLWMIRPCFLYREEYDDCKSIKGRFHQYFIHGEAVDCLQWKRDYDNCSRFEDKKDIKSAQALIESEINRRSLRLKAHFDNNVWTKREHPPSDWDKSLPEWFQKRNANTLLELKSRQAKGEDIDVLGERTLCTIM